MDFCAHKEPSVFVPEGFFMPGGCVLSVRDAATIWRMPLRTVQRRVAAAHLCNVGSMARPMYLLDDLDRVLATS